MKKKLENIFVKYPMDSIILVYLLFAVLTIIGLTLKLTSADSIAAVILLIIGFAFLFLFIMLAFMALMVKAFGGDENQERWRLTCFGLLKAKKK